MAGSTPLLERVRCTATTLMLGLVLVGCRLSEGPPLARREPSMVDASVDVEADAGAAAPAPVTTAPSPSLVRLAFTVDLRGEIEPCGCAVDPLGGVARLASVLARSRETHPELLYLDAGDLEGKAPAKRTAALRAALAHVHLAVRLADAHDLARMKARVPVSVPWATLLSNVHALGQTPKPTMALAKTLLLDVGAARVGLIGLRRPDRSLAAQARRWGLVFDEPAEVASALATELRQRGASVVVALVDVGPLPAVRALLHQIKGLDFAIASGIDNRLEPAETLTPRDDPSHPVILLSPMAQGRELGLLDLGIQHPGALFVDAQRRPRLAARLSDHERQLATLDRGGGSAGLSPERLRHLRESLQRAISEEKAALAAPEPTDDVNTYEEQLVPLDERWPDETQVAGLVAPFLRTRHPSPRPRYSP